MQLCRVLPLGFLLLPDEGISHNSLKLRKFNRLFSTLQWMLAQLLLNYIFDKVSWPFVLFLLSLSVRHYMMHPYSNPNYPL